MACGWGGWGTLTPENHRAGVWTMMRINIQTMVPLLKAAGQWPHQWLAGALDDGVEGGQ